MPLSAKPRSSKAVFKRPRNASMSVWVASWSSYLIQHAFVLPIIHSRQDTVRPFIEFVDGGIARKCLQCPLEKRAAHVPLRLFFPPSPPNSVWWHKGQTHGDRARGANWRVGRAGHLQTPPARPHRSPGGCNERRAGLHH